MGKGIAVTVISRQPKVLQHKRARGNVCDGLGISGKSRKSHKAFEAKIKQEELKFEAYLRKNAMYERLFGLAQQTPADMDASIGNLMNTLA